MSYRTFTDEEVAQVLAWDAERLPLAEQGRRLGRPASDINWKRSHMKRDGYPITDLRQQRIRCQVCKKAMAPQLLDAHQRKCVRPIIHHAALVLTAQRWYAPMADDDPPMEAHK